MFIMINGVAVSLVLDEVPDLVGDAGGVAAVLDVDVASRARHRSPASSSLRMLYQIKQRRWKNKYKIKCTQNN